MRHWIFDFDGTLVDSDGLFSTCLKFALEPYSITVGPNFMEEIRHKHPHRIFEDLLNEDQADEVMERMRQIGEELCEKIQPFSGIEEVLQTLAKKNVSLSIWTGRDAMSCHRILRRTGLDSYFANVISGTCVPTNKPGHDGLLEIQSVYQASPTEMVMVGDHHHDIEPANALGLTSIHAQWKRIPHSLPEKIKPNFAFGCTLKFNEWIQSKVS